MRTSVEAILRRDMEGHVANAADPIILTVHVSTNELELRLEQVLDQIINDPRDRVTVTGTSENNHTENEIFKDLIRMHAYLQTA